MWPLLPWGYHSVPCELMVKGVNSPMVNRDTWGKNPQMKSYIEQLMCNNLFVYHNLIPTIFLNKSGEYSVRCWRVIIFWLRLARKCRLLASVFIARLLILYLFVKPYSSLESIGGFCYPECWRERIMRVRRAVQEQPAVVQEPCSAWVASQVTLMNCWILVASASATMLCQHLPQCSSLGRLLSLGIMQDHDSLPGWPASCSLCCAQPVIFLLVVYLLVWMTHTWKESWNG